MENHTWIMPLEESDEEVWWSVDDIREYQQREKYRDGDEAEETHGAVERVSL